MSELLRAATRMFDSFAALADYCLTAERKKNGEGTTKAAPEAAAAPEAKKERKARAPKEETAVPVAKTAELSEEDSIKEVRSVAKTYVQRFANQTDGITAFRKLMADTCKVGKIDDLVHAQRLQIITLAKAEIARADKPSPVVGVAAGVEV